MLWSQSALKDLEKEETCPERWKAQWIDKIIPSRTNEDVDRGKYFEQLLLGSGAIAGDTITDLPRLDNGSKSTDQLRIEAQAERGRRILFDPHDLEFLGFTVLQTQLNLKFDGEVGTADVLAVDSEENKWLLDVKLTKDLTNTRSIYGWGNDPTTMDLIQLVHYKDLYESIFKHSVRVGLLIFDYSTNKRVKFLELIISENKLKSKKERFNLAKEAVTLYNKNGWITLPSVQECELCPLSCNARKIKNKIIKEIINY